MVILFCVTSSVPVGSLSAKPSMASLRLSLLSQLWRVEPRCFQFLHKALGKPVTCALSVATRRHYSQTFSFLRLSSTLLIGTRLRTTLLYLLFSYQQHVIMSLLCLCWRYILYLVMRTRYGAFGLRICYILKRLWFRVYIYFTVFKGTV
jgi:hypothetical protein